MEAYSAVERLTVSSHAGIQTRLEMASFDAQGGYRTALAETDRVARLSTPRQKAHAARRVRYATLLG